VVKVPEICTLLAQIGRFKYKEDLIKLNDYFIYGPFDLNWTVKSFLYLNCLVLIGWTDLSWLHAVKTACGPKLAVIGSEAFIFSNGIWWAWKHRNLMCLNNEMWSLRAWSKSGCLTSHSNVTPVDRFIK
jgi:hypothetical protein